MDVTLKQTGNGTLIMPVWMVYPPGTGSGYKSFTFRCFRSSLNAAMEFYTGARPGCAGGLKREGPCLYKRMVN